VHGRVRGGHKLSLQGREQRFDVAFDIKEIRRRLSALTCRLKKT